MPVLSNPADGHRAQPVVPAFVWGPKQYMTLGGTQFQAAVTPQYGITTKTLGSVAMTAGVPVVLVNVTGAGKLVNFCSPAILAESAALTMTLKVTIDGVEKTLNWISGDGFEANGMCAMLGVFNGVTAICDVSRPDYVGLDGGIEFKTSLKIEFTTTTTTTKFAGTTGLNWTYAIRPTSCKW
jgi:hypothetical protein